MNANLFPNTHRCICCLEVELGRSSELSAFDSRALTVSNLLNILMSHQGYYSSVGFFCFFFWFFVFLKLILQSECWFRIKRKVDWLCALHNFPVTAERGRVDSMILFTSQ